MVNSVSLQRQQKAESLRNSQFTTPPQSAASASNPRYGGHGAAGLSRKLSKNMGTQNAINKNENKSSSTSNNENIDDTIVRYGDTIRLYSKSQYVQVGGKGGYVGYYCKAKNKRGVGSNRRNGPYVAIPPFDVTKQHLFMPSCFQVVDPRSMKKDGDELLYGEEVMLVDDQGMVWNNCMGPISYLGPKPRGSNGQMNLRFVQESNPNGIESLEETDQTQNNEIKSLCVKYGDLNVKLDVVNVNRRLLKKKYTNFITNFKKDVSKLIGGYLVCDGRGYPCSFTIHHAPPQVEQLSVYSALPSTSSSLMNNQSSVKAGNHSILGHHAVESHYSVPWNTAIFLDLVNFTPHTLNDMQTPQGRVYRSISQVLPPLPISPVRRASTTSSGTSSASSRDGSSNESDTGYRDPICRIILSNGGRATLFKDQIYDEVLNQREKQAEGFWIDLYDVKEEEEEIHARMNKNNYFKYKEKKNEDLKNKLKKQQEEQQYGKLIGQLNNGTTVSEYNQKFSKGSLYIACCLIDNEKKMKMNENSSLVERELKDGDHDESSTTRHHPEGFVGFMKDLIALLFPFILRLWFLLSIIHFLYLISKHFLVTSPSLLVSDFDSFTQNLSKLREMLVDTMKQTSYISSLVKPVYILVLLVKTMATNLFSTLTTSEDTYHLLSTPIFGLICASYIANFFGISMLEPLMSRSRDFDNDLGGDSDELENDSLGIDYLLKPKVRYLNNDNFITSRYSNISVDIHDHQQVEKWELTLIGWDFESAHVMNERMKNKVNSGGASLHRSGSSQSLTGGVGGDLGEIDPNTSMPYMPERFLLAEAGDYAKALERWRDTLAWRKMKEADMVLERPHPNYAITKECYPHFFHAQDKAGNVVYYELPGMINWPRIKAGGLKDSFVDHVMYVQEYMWTILQPSQEDRVTLVLDLSGLTMGLVFNKEILTIIKNIMAMTSTHYPQRSHKMIVINVPNWFGMLFSVVKPLLNEAQKAKICIFRAHEVLEGMRTVIDDCNIPKEYGGSSEYKIGQAPGEKAMCKQVFDNLKKFNMPLTLDETLKNPDGSTATIEEWRFSPRLFGQ